ncbi:hypothetical protein CSA56_05100 [candidate division KSB3 bacterium]|uniref:Fe/B12 periplasmic-binding domain-containing protein n=1 Tax=candidate division KSB3 bacterium TaxID=2044937 RepID=A0A2G6KHT7_9BACT|nr:MAG: hypothetical protein CSA56_05100 [candidate division KSB3 bacterium]
MKKHIVIFATIIIVFAAFTGYSSTSDAETTRVVVDELGREITIPENPQRVLGLTSAAMEAVYNLGLKPVGKIAEYKVRKEGMKLPSVGKAQSVNIEAIYALAPDLIIANSRFHAVLEDELEGSGAAVYFFDPEKAGDIPFVELTAYIGRVLNRVDAGEAFVASAFAQAEKLAAQIAEKRGFKTGIMLRVGEKVLAAQSASSFGSMLSLLGIKNIVPANLPNAKKSSFVMYDIEQIVADNPDVIFLIAQSKDQEANAQMLQQFMADTKWAALDAVKHKTVFILPFSANPNRSAPVDMLKITANVLLKGQK